MNDLPNPEKGNEKEEILVILKATSIVLLISTIESPNTQPIESVIVIKKVSACKPKILSVLSPVFQL